MRPVNNSPSFFYPKTPVDVPEMEQSLLPRTEGEGTSRQPAKKEGPTFLNRFIRPTANLLSVLHDGNTPLHQAIKQGNFAKFGSLLAKTPNPDSLKNNSGKTPLSYAAEIGHPDMVNALLANPNVKPYTVDKDGRTPLSYAAEKGHLDIVNDIVKALQAAQADPHLPDTNDRTPLSYAAAGSNFNVVKTLLATPGVKPDLADKNGRTPLSYAAENGRFDIVKLLLEAGANPNLPDQKGRTPLSYAAEKGHVGAVMALLENADTCPDMRGPDGKTPLHHAAENNHPNVVVALLDARRVDPNLLEVVRLVNPNLQDEHGLTPLASATLKDQFNTVATLLKDAQVDPNLADDKGYTPLHHAAEKGGRERLRITEALLGNVRLNPNLQEKKHGYTALACAVLRNDPHVSKALLAHRPVNVNVNLSDNQGRTPFFLATTCHSEFIDMSVFNALLEDYRVAHHQRARSGMTAFENLLDGPITTHPAYTYVMSMLKNDHVRQGILPTELIRVADRLDLYSHQRRELRLPERQS